MDISKIDQNFKNTEIEKSNAKAFHLPCQPFSLHGGFFDPNIGFVRMPQSIVKQVSAGVAQLSQCCAGIRVLFSTNSKSIKLHAKIIHKCLMNHMAFFGSAGFTLCEVSGGKEKFIGNLAPSMDSGNDEFEGQLNLGGDIIKDYILFFPLYSGVADLILEFDCDSIIKEYKKYKKDEHILYYGSSITQGGCASKANNCYQSYISEWTNTDYTNLGFSGNAKGEDAMIEFLREFDCSCFVCDYDHNAPNPEHLKNTHLKLYKGFRENPSHKNIPIIFISKPDGKRDSFGEARFNIIKDTYCYAKSIGDENVYLIDGRTIYPEEIEEHCAVDGCHPTDLGFYFFAKKLYEVIKPLVK